MTRIIHCPNCRVELTIPEAAGSRRLKCPKCATRFYPDGPKKSAPAPKKPAAGAGPPKKAKVPPSSRDLKTFGGHGDADVPTASGDLRDVFDVPLLDEDDRPASSGRRPRPPSGYPAVSDAEALFRDDDPIPSRRRGAEARLHPRRCPTCGSVVPAGMSLCERCGLDLDTGQRMVLDVIEEEAPPLAEPSGPPFSVVMIGVMGILCGGALAFVSFAQLGGLGGGSLGVVSLFGVIASFQFLAGKTMKPLVAALLIGAVVDVVVLIAMPVILANMEPVLAPGVAGEAPPQPETPQADEKGANSDDNDPVVPQVAPIWDRLDKFQLFSGILILLADGVLLVYLSSATVRQHFERRHHVHDETGPVMP